MKCAFTVRRASATLACSRLGARCIGYASRPSFMFSIFFASGGKPDFYTIGPHDDCLRAIGVFDHYVSLSELSRYNATDDGLRAISRLCGGYAGRSVSKRRQGRYSAHSSSAPSGRPHSSVSRGGIQRKRRAGMAGYSWADEWGSTRYTPAQPAQGRHLTSTDARPIRRTEREPWRCGNGMAEQLHASFLLRCNLLASHRLRGRRLPATLSRRLIRCTYLVPYGLPVVRIFSSMTGSNGTRGPFVSYHLTAHSVR